MGLTGRGQEEIMNHMKWTKRIMAMTLTLCMMLSSMAGYVPGWFAAFAEEAASEEQVAERSEAPQAVDTASGASAAPAETQGDASEKQEETPAQEEAAQKPSPSGEGGTAQSAVTDEVVSPAETIAESNAQGETTSPVSADAEPAPQGSADPDSLESVHWTDSQALVPPEGEANGDAFQKPSPSGEGVASQSDVTEEVVSSAETIAESNAQEETTSPVSADAESASLKGEAFEEEQQPASAEGSQPPEEPAPVEPSVSLNVNPEPVTGPAVPVIAHPEEHTAANTIEETAAEAEPVGLIVLFQGDEETAPEATSGEPQTPAPEAVGPRTLNTRAGQYTITAEGNLPEGAVLRVVEIPADAAEKMAGNKALFAYDVQILVDGKVWQPEEHGEEVRISIQDQNGELNSDHISVLHVKTNLVNEDGSLSEDALAETIAALDEDNADSEKIDTSASEGVVSFTTTSLSPLVASATAALEVMVNEALAKVTGKLTGRVKVVLAQNTTYEGNVNINAGAREVADDFELELSAEDAGEDGMDGAGATVVSGNITIKGIKVIMNSVMMAAGKAIIVQNAGKDAGSNSSRGGALVYNGAQSLANEVKVEVGSNSSAEITTLGEDDIITATAKGGAKSLKINAGDGANRVTAYIGGGDADILTGAGNDTVQVSITGGDSVNVDTGAGADNVTVVDNGATENGITVNTGAGDDTVTADVRAAAGDMTINTGLGGDIVAVLKGDHHSTENINYSQNQNKNEQFRNADTGATVRFVNGDDNAVDRFTIDVNAAGAIRKIDLSGGKGASVHLKGDLNPAFAKDPNYRPIEGTADNFTLHTVAAQQSGLVGDASDLALNIVTHASDTAKYNFTDALTGKRTVYVYAVNPETVNGKTQFTYDAGNVDDFTNYVFATKVKDLDSIVFNVANKPFMSNVVLDAKQTRDDDETIYVRDLSASDMNLLLKGAQIIIAGTVTAKNVRAESIQGIATMGEAFGNLMHFAPNADGTSSFDPDLQKTVEDMISMLDRAHINVAFNAKVTAENDIALLSRVKQFGKIFAFIPDGFNLLNLKIASAAVKIDGELTAQTGSVAADALIETTTGYTPEFDDEGNVIDVAKDGAQISANVIVNDAAVIVNGKITAAEDVLLNARSDIKVYNYGTFGTITAALPATIAATVIINKVKSEVRFGAITAGHSVKLNAEGDVVDETKASLGDKAKSAAINAFVAVNVVNQDVSAAIGRGATVKADADVVVHSTAVADIQTVATSEVPEEQSEASDSFTARSAMRIVNKLLDPVKSVFSSLASGFADAAGGLADEFMEWWSDGKDTANSIDEAMAKVSAGAYSVKVVEPDAENAQKGSATVSVKLKKDTSFKLDPNDPARKTDENTGNQLYAVVTPEPKSGYTVAKVQYRYLVAGQDHYTYRTVEKDASGLYAFPVGLESATEDYEVIVTFKEGTAPAEKPEINKDEYEDVYDLSSLFGDALNSAGDGDGDEDFQMDADVATHANHQLEIIQPDSQDRVLTWLTNDKNENLSVVYGGQKIRFIPNPASGNKLESLKISYSSDNAKGQDIVTADAQGRFVYTVPEDIPANVKLTVTAVFAAKEPDEPEPARTQFGGAVAVGVVLNDNDTAIDAGATVEAGGKLDMLGAKRTVNDILADGTAVKEGLGGTAAAPADDEPIPTVVSSFSDPDKVYQVSGAEYAVKVSSSLAGTINGSMQKADGGSKSHPVVTFKPADANVDWSKVKVVVSYYTKLDHSLFTGTRVTSEETINRSDLTVAEDGTVTYRADMLSKPVVAGTTMEISLVFLDDSGNAMTTENSMGATDYMVKNPINVSYNALTTVNNDSITEIGSVTEHVKSGTPDNKYYFEVKPKDGYKLAGEVAVEGGMRKSNTDSLYATWRANGQEYKASLKHDSGDAKNVWYFDATDGNLDLPEGVIVNIVAVFSEDKHDVVKAEKAKDASGKELSKDQVDVSKAVTVNKPSAKAGDKVTVAVKDSGEWHASGIKISYLGYDGTEESRLEKSFETLVTDKDDQGNFVFTMPQLAGTDAARMTIIPVYAQKKIPLKVEGSTGASDNSDKSIVLSETSGKGYNGETITVAPSAGLQKEGYKVTGLTVSYNGVTSNPNGDSFTIAQDYTGNSAQSMQIHATLALKPVKIETYTDPWKKGAMEGACGRAEAGEKVIINIIPEDGYRLKYGTGRAILSGGGVSQQIVLKRDGENRYYFTMPDGVGKDTVVELKGEFEEGSDGSDVNFSMGMAVAVGVTVADNDVEIEGDETIEKRDGTKTTIPGAQVTAGGGISMAGISLGGKAVTQAKAGFSEGNTGVAGALAVQVASVDTDVAIRENAGIAVKDGAINLLAKGKQEFRVVGDASGKKDGNAASGTGVGSGIAVAVDSIHTKSTVEDGVVLMPVDDTQPVSHINGISISAVHKVKDTVGAKAGAAGGGTSLVPVAAVDVYNAGADAYMGALNRDELLKKLGGKENLTDDEQAIQDGYLPVSGKVTVKAAADSDKVQYNHQVTADASSAGGKTAIGGAFVVTWISNKVNAKLDQSIKGTRDIAISARGGDALKAVATASASGGASDDSDGDKKESGADKQANKLLGGAGGLAGKYGNMDGGEIMNDSKDRQKSETAESTVSVAGAFVLNMQKNKVRAEILDGVDIDTAGAVSVHSANRTDATVKANASATNSDVGVGVGIALNIVKMDNIARVGNGGIRASGLEIVADIAEAPTKTRTVNPVQGASGFKTEMTEKLVGAIRELVGEDVYPYIEPMVAADSAFVATFYDKLIKDLNLESLFNVKTDGLGGSFENAANLIWDRLQAFPKALVAPLWDIVEQGVDTVSGFDEQKLKDIVDTAWKAALIQGGGDALSIFTSTVTDSKDALIGATIDTIVDKIEGKGNGENALANALKDTVKSAFSKIVDAAVKRMVTEISKELPIVNASNVELVKSLKDTTMEKFAGSVIPYITETFRTEVYDYEPIAARIQESGLADYLESELRALMKESTAAFTNEMIDKALGKLNVKFEREAIADRHIVTTQAISGAGAKESSGAGSLAIAVANLNTKAEIADGKDTTKTIEITDNGALAVNAEEARRIRTHATAAVDADGEADNNEGAGDTEEAQTGGSAASQEGVTSKDGMVTVVTSGAGGSVKFGDTEDGRLYITLDKGYKLSNKDITRTYTNADGDEVIDTVTLEAYGDDYLVIPTEGTGVENLDEDERKNFHISLDIQFEEDLRAIPAVTLKKNGNTDYNQKYKDSGKAITYSVEGKEGSDKVGKAKYGDLVEITIPQVDELDPYEVCVYDGEGNMIARYEMEPQYAPKLPEGAQTMTKVSANYNETVLAFRMTDADIGKVELMFTEGLNEWGRKKALEERDAKEAAEQKEKTRETDRAGRKVGVGAAFTLTYGNSDVKATIGQRYAPGKNDYAPGVTAGSVAVTASSDHEEENYATAGTDPLEGVNVDEDSEKDVGVDASVSLNILDNDIIASIAKYTVVKTTRDDSAGNDGEEDEDEEEEEIGEDEPEPIKVGRGGVVVDATEIGASETKASAFATGSTSAVGASVALNISLSDIKAKVGYAVDAAGRIDVRAHSLSMDDTWSFASAMGADMQRNLNKVSKFTDGVSDLANSLTTGSIFDKKAKDKDEKKKSNDTSKRITDRMNNDQVKSEDGSEASENLSVSTNALRAMGAKFDKGGDAKSGASGATDIVNKQGGQSLGGDKEEKDESPKLQVAATVGVTVALHNAAVEVDGARLKAGEGISLTARNAGNFNTRSTAASMGLEESNGGNSIAAAVGVSVNNNKATVDVYSNIDAGGDVTIDANLTQNLTDTYKGRLAVQSISGAVSGDKTDKSISGAISALVSHATTRASIVGMEEEGHRGASEVKGANVSVMATDKSKLAIRAGGINVSKGAATGMGMSAATIWSGNDVKANLGSAIDVTADSFALNAKKLGVTHSDYKFPFTWQDLVSDSSDLDDEERENVYTGLIDVHRKPGETAYTVDVNLDTYALMKIPDMLNFLSSNNYYVESIAGSVMKKASEGEGNKLNLSGSVSIVRTNNKINTVVGNNATITTNKKAQVNGVDLQARGDNNTRLIGGALTAGEGKNSAGLVVTFLSATDTVKTTVGSGVTIDAGNVNQKAHSDVNVQTFNAAAAANTAEKDEAKTIGGALDILLLNNKVENSTGELTTLNSGNDIDIGADAAMDLLVVSASLSAAKKGTAAGGTIQFVNDQTKASVDIARDHSLTAGRNVAINAVAKDKVISVIASASGAPDDKSTAVAGSLNVINAATKGLVNIGAGSKDKNIKATNGDVTVKADTGANVINVTAAMAGSGGKAVGLSANVNVFNRKSEVEIAGGDEYVIRAGGNVQAEAAGNDFTVMAGLAASGSTGEGAAVSGNLPIVVGLNTVKTTLNKVAVEAGGSAAIDSHLKDRAYAIAGTIAASNAGNAMGATAMVVVKENTVKTDLGESSVTAGGAKTVKLATTGKDYSGVYVDAKVRQTLVAGAAGVAAGGAKGITANIVTVVSGNGVGTDASKAALKADSGDVTVNAQNDSKQTVFAGGLSIGKSMGIGASVIVNVARNDVKALAHDMDAAGDVNVTADNDDKAILLNVNVGASGGNTAELGVTVTSLESKANAEVASEVTSKEGSFSLKANNTSNITNVAVALAAGAKNAATPVFVYTGYSGEANAMLKAGTVNAKKAVTVAANSNKNVNQYTVGMSASGKVALSGAVSIMKLGDKTNAIVGAPVITNAAKMNVTADSDYKLVGATGTIAASGKAGVAVNGMLTIVKASTLAEMGGKATLTASEGMNVKASSKRDVISAALSVGVGGTGGGVSVGLMGLVAGDKMDQEAADQLTYGNATNKDRKLFDASAVIAALKKKGIDTRSMNNLSEDLEGNGQTTDTSGLGHSEGSGKTFDVASGYSDGTDGENSKASETDDVKRAKLVGSTAYSDSPKDAVIARISETADITGAVTAHAEQETLADMYGASVGAGGTVGGGISIAIAKLRSNVLASSLGTIHANDNQVTVEAVSKSGESKADDDEKARSNALKTSLGDKINPAKRSIRSIGLAAADGGEVGAAVAAGFVRLDNITEATLAGHVEKASGIDVNAKADYNNVMAATIAAAVGSTAGIAGSLAIAVADGTVKATMGKNKTAVNAAKQDGEFSTNGNINVTTDSNFGANAITVSAAGGLVGGAGGVAIATNNLTQDTAVERGAKLTDLGKAATLNVKATSTSAANGYLLGLSAGAGAVGIGVSVVKVKPTVNTTVGVAGANSGTTTLDGFANVNIANDVASEAESNLLSAAVGAVSVGVNVMTVYNDTKADAKAANLRGSVNNLNISGQLAAKGVSNVAAVSAGAVGIGVAVNYVDVNSKNRAEADLTNGDITINNKLSVTTGDANYSRQTSATTNSISAAAGLGVVAVNTSVARNRAVNEAVILGNTLAAKDVDLKSYSKGSATAKLTGAGVGGINVVTSVVNALNETTSNAKMALSGALNGNLTVRSDVQGDTKANLLTGGGSILGDVTTNVATANGRTAALADIAIGKGTGKKQSIDSQVTGKDTVKTTIENLIGLSLGLSVATMVGGAHSHDVYDNKVKLSGGEYDLSGVNVTTDYETTADSNVTPSSAGVRINSSTVAVNRSSATSDAYAGAMLTLEKAKAAVDGDLNIKTTGTSTVTGVVKPAAFEYSVSVNIGSNKSRAESKGTQAATLKLIGGQVTRANAVDVQSVVKAADAKAVVSANGVSDKNKKSVKISGVVRDANTTNAAQNIASTAAILGEGADNAINAAILNVKALNDKAITSEGRTDGAYSVGLATSGSLEGTASTGAVYNAVLNGVKAIITGDAVLLSSANATASVTGMMPGSLSAVGGLHSDIKAGVGTQANRQTSKVLIGEGATLEAGRTLQLHALNDGSAVASFRQGASISLAKSADSSQPVDSWYDTGVVVGNGAKLSGGNNNGSTAGLDILSQTKSNSTSEVNAKSVGLLINTNKMKGEVIVHSDTNVTIGEKAQLAAKGEARIRTAEATKALAHTDLSGGGLFDGTDARAVATVTRYHNITLGKGASVTSENSNVFIQSRSGGWSDDIQVIAYVSAGGAISLAKARTDATVTSGNEIHLLEGVTLTAKKDVNVLAVADSHGGAKKDGSGIYVYPRADSYGVGVAPEAKAVLTMNFTTYVNINRGGSTRVKLTSKEGNINIYANNEGLRVYSDPGAHGKAAGGSSTAKTDVIANLSNLIWIDAADFNAKNQINILANNGNSTKAKILVDTVAELKSAFGKVRAENWIKGTLNSQIRSNNTKNVTFKASKVTHTASVNIQDDVDYTRKRSFITTSKKGGNNWEWTKYWRCDFCGKSGGKNPGDIKTRGAINASLKSAMQKALSPLTDIQRMVDNIGGITRARYGEEDYAAASKIFVLDMSVMLEKDVTMKDEQIEKYRLWNNSATYLDVYLLPNATRLYGNRRGNKLLLQYVAEVLRGDIRGDGEIHEIDIITALTDRAFAQPLMPVGSTGSLNFLTGVLTLPSLADFELYLHEVSKTWLIEAWNVGYFQALMADQDEINNCALNGGDLPQGEIVTDLIDDGETDGWHYWWIGASPETASDPDQTLICLMTNAETDEVDAFRTTVNMIANGEEPVDVSLYMYRDSNADRLEAEKYNVMFFDTPEGEKSLVKVITDVLMGHEIETPLPMRIVLRGFRLDGADLPVYSISDHFFAMCDGTDGKVNMFDDFYTNTYVDGVYDSEYIRIEGIVDGDLNVTFKGGQLTWLEWFSEKRAKDLRGNWYVLVGTDWYPEDEVSGKPDQPEDAVAA